MKISAPFQKKTFKFPVIHSSNSIRISVILFLLLISFGVSAQKKIKTGFGFGAIPAVSFDSDLGLQYGAIVNLYHYGDGSNFPKYDHSLYLEYSRYTKGTGINRLMYDTEKLIPGVRTTVDFTYLTDQMMDFYGFNGYQTNYDEELRNNIRHFYKNERNMFRVKADFQGNFGASNFGWVAGYTFYNFDMDTVNIDKLGLSPAPGGSLFQRYVKNGLISAEEADGGSINYFKFGLKYDTRDQRASPSRGVWTEAVVQAAPGFLNEFAHSKFALIHRQYYSPFKDFTLAYRIDYQSTIGKSHVPYYAQPLLITSFLTAAYNQGLGGKNSIRGVLRNRVVGDAVGFGNFEIRYKFLRFDWLKQHFYIGTNLFFDTGLILKPISVPDNLSAAQKTELMLGSYEKGKFHSAAGIGLKIGWNENFIISADWGKAFNKQDGNSGMYIGLNYLF